ncbi:branched-chain amino acid ABC transporter permease [Shimia sp. R11_0]|uniref:LIV-I protein H n=1 Tax=Shimia marina TaxID=321267 RepID=A0A0P1FEG3_9RHOB|nr:MULTISPECIES: branched-chain amino acid ABC transporter permease [Shimia]MBO9475931.1 branched-chain amino acid ABC transporter permease [Shimia sp. R11_0]CUH52639.1 LIV-I protein H [Shimia marina]SFE68241.1 amino acid/amide ABC transporter membrane protein 1, HAAT family [Shimia marina]
MEVVQLLVSGLANGCVYGLIALGFVLIYKATEQVNFAQGDFMMLGAFVCLGLTNAHYMGLPFWLAAPLAVVIMAVLGYLLDFFVLRHLFGQSQTAVVILTIALGFVIRFVAGVIWGHEPQTLESPLAVGDFNLGGVVLGMADLAVIVVTVLLTLCLYQFFQRTRLGLAMQAASQNQMAAYFMGIPVKRVQGMIWGLSGAVAAVAGILFASKGAIEISSGLLGIKAFAAAVIGGFGSLPGALMGGLIVGVIEPFASYYFPAGYSQIAPYALLLLVLVFRPHGLFSQVRIKKV